MAYCHRANTHPIFFTLCAIVKRNLKTKRMIAIKHINNLEEVLDQVEIFPYKIIADTVGGLCYNEICSYIVTPLTVATQQTFFTS